MKRGLKVMPQMRIGILTYLRDDPHATIHKVRELGFTSCQVWLRAPDALTDSNLRGLVDARKRYGVTITGLWIRCAGPAEWNFQDGPRTIGIVPRRWRKSRVRALQAAADFAAALEVPMIATHCGFIPESPGDPLYAEVIEALEEIVVHCRERKIAFCFETGQETPVVLLRCIEDLGYESVGINFDFANLIGYGKANPVDALDMLGEHVLGVHAKDATPPPNGRELGRERPIGKGHVNFPALLSKLQELKYSGDIIIENEMESPTRIAEIQSARAFLQAIIDEQAQSQATNKRVLCQL